MQYCRWQPAGMGKGTAKAAISALIPASAGPTTTNFGASVPATLAEGNTMKTSLALVIALLAPVAQAKPLIIANNAWRASALNDLVPILRSCLPKADQTAPARLPASKDAHTDLEANLMLQEPSTLGQGYWYRMGWRAKDGAVFVVAARSPDGKRLVFGPVGADWQCLPADIRKELARS
jgi:hypothetical protein